MEILYRILIGIISSKIFGMIDGIVLQCRRDKANYFHKRMAELSGR